MITTGENDVDPGQELVIRRIAREEAERAAQAINIDLLKENFLTRGEFIDALDRLDKRFDAMQEQMDKRFSAMQEQMDKRFDDMQEQIDKRFADMQEQMDKRFDAMNERFAAVDDHFISIDKHIESIEVNIIRMSIAINRIENKEGQLMEQAILDFMREALQMEDVDPAKITKHVLVDKTGAVFWKGYSSDIDVLVSDGNVYTIEIKGRVDSDDLAHYLQNVRLFEINEGRKVTRAVLVVLRIPADVKNDAESLGVLVIAGEVIEL